MDLIIFLGSLLMRQVLSYEYMPPNMGSVIYNFNDCTKMNWDKDDLALLQARMYAQQVVPPVNTGIVVNEKYIKTLMTYFRDVYKTIKLESHDPRTGEIMTAAASDALGGYLKSWMLPITKFAFYGGTVSHESAKRVINFYDDIKHFLKTDGSDWRTPDLEDLRYVAVNIATPPTVTHLGFTTDPCKNIAFFEKTDSGLKIPIPTISWDESGPMMFIPLKSPSIISLSTPASTNALFQYYEAAKRCVKAANGFDEADFDHRLESWLVSKVLPHLNDEKLYYGLNSVLTLINKTNELSDKLINLYVNRSNYTQTLTSPSYSSYMSKKVIIITIILFLEICWCIPAMFYMKFSKNKKKPRSKDNFLSVCVSYGDKSVKGISVIGEVKRSKHRDDHGVKFQGQQRLKGKHSDSRKRYVYNNLAHITKRTNSRLDDHVPMICASNEIRPHSRDKNDFLNVEPYCISNASINTSSSIVPRHKNLDKNDLESTKTLTLFTNTEPRRLFKEQNAKVQTTKTKSRHSQVTILKDLPIVFQDPSKTSSIISTKITKIVIARDEREEKGKFFNTHKQINKLSHSNEKGHYKQNAIILSRKGTKSNVQKQFGIKIERQDIECGNFNSNEKTTSTKSNKGVCDYSKLCIREIKTEPKNASESNKQSGTKTDTHDKQNVRRPVFEKDCKSDDHSAELSSVIFSESTTVDDEQKINSTI